MNTQDLTDWFNAVFWVRYCHMLKVPHEKTKWGPGGKGKALKRILTLKPSKELRDKIELELIEQTRHRRLLCDKLGLTVYLKETATLAKNGNGDIYKNRQAVTWVNQMGWEDEVPEIEKEEIRDKKYCACGQETMGPAFTQCALCYADRTAKLRLVK